MLFKPNPTLRVGDVASPSGRLVGESTAAAMRRWHEHPNSPGGARDRSLFVPRSRHALNHGTGFRLGHQDAYYHPYDFATPIIDSLRRLHRRRGYGQHSLQCYDENPPLWVTPNGTNMQVAQTWTSEAPLRSEKQDSPAHPVCMNCSTVDPGAIMLDADRCNYSCNHCGAVQMRTNRKSLNRDRACTADEDKTTRGDAFVTASNRFDIAFTSVSESRRHQAMTTVQSSFVSQRAKKRHRLGYSHETMRRAAVLATEARSRMTTKQHTKNTQLIISLERSFDALEPIDNQLKRFLRMEIDRAYRASVLHSQGCGQGDCRLNLADRSNAGVAMALINVCLARLLDGRETVDSLSHAHILAVRDRVHRCDASVQSAARAIQASLHTLLDSRSEAVSLPPCCKDQQGFQGFASQSPGTSSVALPPKPPEEGSPSIKRARKCANGTNAQELPTLSGLTITPSSSDSSFGSSTSLESTTSNARTVINAVSLAPSLDVQHCIPQLSVKRLDASLSKIWTLLPGSAESRATMARLVSEPLFRQAMSRAVHVHKVKSTVLLAVFVDNLGKRLGRLSEVPEEVRRLATANVLRIVVEDLAAFLPSVVEAEPEAEFF